MQDAVRGNALRQQDTADAQQRNELILKRRDEFTEAYATLKAEVLNTEEGPMKMDLKHKVASSANHA